MRIADFSSLHELVDDVAPDHLEPMLLRIGLSERMAQKLIKIVEASRIGSRIVIATEVTTTVVQRP